jgi:tetratricopeptide (TPR) repeat protein
LLCLAISWVSGGVAGEAQPADLQALRDEIEAGYHARDLQRIDAAREKLLAMGKDPASRDLAAYYAAYGRFRQGLVAAGDKPSARRYLDDCIGELEDLVERRPDDAGAHALLASCYGTSSRYYMRRAATRGMQAGRHLGRALQLAPDDPWVVLQDAIADYSRPAAFGGDKERARQKLEHAAQLFAASHPPGSTQPVWGEAETWLYLGLVHRDAGRRAEARQALEHTLSMAPDHRDAEEALRGLQ